MERVVLQVPMAGGKVRRRAVTRRSRPSSIDDVDPMIGFTRARRVAVRRSPLRVLRQIVQNYRSTNHDFSSNVDVRRCRRGFAADDVELAGFAEGWLRDGVHTPVARS